MITFIKSFIVTVLIIMFAISIAELLTGCVWQDSNNVKCETRTTTERHCSADGKAKQLEILIESRQPDE